MRWPPLPHQAFTPIITMLSLFVARLETPSRRLVASVSFIALGTALASAGEVNLNVAGVVIMMLSECFESIRLVMTQLLLTGLRFHPSEHRPPRGGGWGGMGGRPEPLSRARERDVVRLCEWLRSAHAGLVSSVLCLASW